MKRRKIDGWEFTFQGPSWLYARCERCGAVKTNRKALQEHEAECKGSSKKPNETVLSR